MAFDRPLIEAKLALEQIKTEEMPPLAWDALEAGFDGHWIRRMAALDGRQWSEIEPVLPHFMQEAGLEVIDGDTAFARLAQRFARELLATGTDPLSVDLFKIYLLWARADYPKIMEKVGMLSDECHIATLFEGKEIARERALAVLREAADLRLED